MRSESLYESNIARSEKIFVSNEGSAMISCPRCGKTKQVAVGKYCGKKHTIKVRCSCNTSFLAYLEFRRNYRKPTDLSGTYRIISDGAGGGTVSIKNISRGGIGFSVSGRHNIEIGQKALVDFVLDNRKSSRVSKEVIVRSVTNNHIGCQFVSHQPFEKDLGFYLQP